MIDPYVALRGSEKTSVLSRVPEIRGSGSGAELAHKGEKQPATTGP
jgi:hypothetical protein